MKSLLQPRPAPVFIHLQPAEWQPVWSDLVRCRHGLDEAMLGLLPLQDQLNTSPPGLVDDACSRVAELQQLLARLYELLATSTPGAVADVSATASLPVAFEHAT
ncbi:MAG TPA: hypothetical protein VKK19_17110 [Candidatus Dormibacteraeota bacterium]|nr:hypothetical protein [Candidatus Dormibacteraeota bacterium]